ncbi:unnamed protein product [Calypogeia fissa]
MSYRFFGIVWPPTLSSDVLVPVATMGLDECLDAAETLVYTMLAGLDALITVVAFIQLLRLYFCNRHAGWTRQKVFHCLIVASNFGYSVYFVLNPVAACGNWACWPNACGFVLIAIPQTIFLATFLLLLSFWVDLCHQATDQDEEEEEDEADDGTYSPSSPGSGQSSVEKQSRRCCVCFRRLRVRGRQKNVIIAVLLMCALTVAFAALIWYGKGDNPVDSQTIAEAYSYFYAIITFLSGGGLAAYGLVLYMKMCRLRSGKASEDITKVAGLAVVSVVCFTLRASVIVFSDIPVINIWSGQQEFSVALTLLYYLVGQSFPSVVVLWVMREIPRRPSFKGIVGHGANGVIVRTRSQAEAEQALLSQQAILDQWIIPAIEAEPPVSYSRSYKSTPPQVGRASPL